MVHPCVFADQHAADGVSIGCADVRTAGQLHSKARGHIPHPGIVGTDLGGTQLWPAVNMIRRKHPSADTAGAFQDSHVHSLFFEEDCGIEPGQSGADHHNIGSWRGSHRPPNRRTDR